MKTIRIVPQGTVDVIRDDLYMSLELGDKQWKLTISDSRRNPSRYTVSASDPIAVVECLSKG